MANLNMHLEDQLKRRSAFQVRTNSGTGGLGKHIHFYCRISWLCWLSVWGPGSMRS